jgi:hypothetical protein
VADALTDETRPSSTDSSVLDASLVAGGLQIGVETKITGALDSSQIVRHLRGLGHAATADQLTADAPFLLRRTWSDVAVAVAGVAEGDPVARAFGEYLHILGLSSFRGFTPLDSMAWNSWSNSLSQDFLRNRLVALGDAVRAVRPNLFGPGGLVPIREAADGPRSHSSRGEFSLRWALADARKGDEAVTANVFIEPAAGPLDDGAFPTVGMSLFMGRSYRIAEAVAAKPLGFLDDLHSPMFLGGEDSFRLRLDRWERGPGGSRWNNAKVNNDGRRAWREWTVRTLVTPPFPDWTGEVRALIDASVAPNDRRYSPSLSFYREWNSREHGGIINTPRLVEDVAGQLDRVRLAMGSVRAFLRG